MTTQSTTTSGALEYSHKMFPARYYRQLLPPEALGWLQHATTQDIVDLEACAEVVPVIALHIGAQVAPSGMSSEEFMKIDELKRMLTLATEKQVQNLEQALKASSHQYDIDIVLGLSAQEAANMLKQSVPRHIPIPRKATQPPISKNVPPPKAQSATRRQLPNWVGKLMKGWPIALIVVLAIVLIKLIGMSNAVSNSPMPEEYVAETPQPTIQYDESQVTPTTEIQECIYTLTFPGHCHPSNPHSSCTQLGWYDWTWKEGLPAHGINYTLAEASDPTGILHDAMIVAYAEPVGSTTRRQWYNTNSTEAFSFMLDLCQPK